ncbi:MAG: FAD:protein FMN transferase [Myxococcota bacterium]
MERTVVALALLSCGGETNEIVETVEVEADEPAAEPARRELFTRSRPLMGTVFIIRVDADPEVAAPAVAAAFDELERLETVLSEWREDSEISRINQQAGSDAVSVSPDVFEVVRAGVNVSRWSEGAFDLSWAALRGLYDFRPGRQRIPRRSDVRQRLRLIRYQDITIDESARSVLLEREGMAIGTGGIGKGYALDRAGEILRNAGIQSYMLFGGGQVQVRGLRPDEAGPRPWRVGIQHPRRGDEYFAFFEAQDVSISTSGDYEHFFIDERGKRWHHILDPRTGLPVNRTVSITLMAPNGLHADALSTAAFVLGPERALEMLAALPFRAEAIMLDSDCRVHSTPGTFERLQLRVTLEEGGVVPGC